jgi:hypothetical protein
MIDNRRKLGAQNNFPQPDFQGCMRLGFGSVFVADSLDRVYARFSRCLSDNSVQAVTPLRGAGEQVGFFGATGAFCH